jgi:ATP-binding cassette, subfamily F, member 3
VPLITAEGLSKGYGGHTLFDDATFQIEAGDKVALVGPNGAGKSTLLRILAGREKTDHGTFRFTGVRVHWFDQHPAIPAGATVRSLLTAAKPVPPALQKRKDALEARISEPSLYEQPGFEAVLEEYAELEREIKVQTTAGPAESAIMGQLGVLDLDQSAASLSGGEKTRVFLARTLQAVRSGDMVVLDEPTNHLDVDSIEWLEDWIQAFDGTVLLVAHDRAFLDTVATRVFEVKQGRITCYVGNYEDYIAARDEDIERARREHAKAEDRVQSAKATIQQFRHQKRFDGQYASRMKALDKYKAALERTPDPVLEKLGFGLAFGAVEKVSNEMLRMTGLHKSYSEPVLKGLDLELKKGDRLGLVGANGAGKSTLLRILTGREKKDAGTLHVAPAVKGAFFSQEHDDLQLTRTLLEEVRDARGSLEERDVKALLGRFRFNPDSDLRRTVSTLSGGERQRMMLLKCVLKPSNLLILDEPTNHLDLWARDVVIEALNAYHGTLVVVSHDRFLLDSVTETTAVLDDGILHYYSGTFTETRDLHRKKAQVRQGARFVVRKRFADWKENRKYAPGEEVEIPESRLAESMTLRNALSQGWLERL